MRTKICVNCGAKDVPERNVLCTSCGKIADKVGGKVAVDTKEETGKKGRK
jgi:NMD protein affecting ribosome stability and mRNA decay